MAETSEFRQALERRSRTITLWMMTGWLALAIIGIVVGHIMRNPLVIGVSLLALPVLLAVMAVVLSEHRVTKSFEGEMVELRGWLP